jgi:hypothetical protein
LKCITGLNIVVKILKASGRIAPMGKVLSEKVFSLPIKSSAHRRNRHNDQFLV